MKVRIKKVPQARTGYQVQGGLVNDVPAMGGADIDSYTGIPDIKFNRTLKAVPREEANLEAEGRETAMVNTGNIPAFYKISGPRHAQGGVPLNLPDDSFIFSDFREMRIKDPKLLAKFGKAVKGKSFTPAELSKQYDINKYRQILQDPNSDAIDRKTAEIMIRNYNMKLGALALAQESKKGFPQGIPAVARPFMEANGLSEEDFIPKEEEEATEPGMEQEGEEMMEEENQAPETMPNGEPVAMPQGQPQMPPQGMQPPMQYGGIPMIDYGASMGGYNFPYIPEHMANAGVQPYRYGGLTTYDGGGEKVKGKTGEIPATKVAKLPGKGTKTKTIGGKEAEIIYTPGAERQSARQAVSGSGNGRVSSGWEAAICDMIKKGATYEELTVPSEKNGFKTHMAPGADSKAIFDRCNTKDVQEKFQEKEEAVYIEPEEVNEQECECTYPDGSTERMPKNADGTCPPCEKEVEEEVQADYGPEVPVDNYAPWWLQDTVNTLGAYGDYTGINKYYPATARIDLEEPNPTFLDPTRELAAQSEQANIASAASNEFAGNAQQAGARLANIQGQGALQSGNVLSNINNQNANIANQFEGQQVGIRNQENLMRHQLWNDLYDKNVVANQQYDNARRQALANMRQQYNTALTNRAKTDALNQMYQNYKVDPSTGGFMNYIPTERDPNPIKPEDEIAYAQSLEAAGLPKEVIATMVKERMRRGNQGLSAGPDPNAIAAMYGQRGGFLKNGGYVYADTIFPFIM